MKKILILFFTFIGFTTVASHIVGGEITYQYVSKANNGDITYAVTLSLYLDCKNGNPQSIAADAVAYFNVFDAQTGTLIKSLGKTVNRQNPIRVSANAYKCIKNAPDVCIDMYLYNVNMVLPKNTNGYIITFERCCRNIIIANIVTPENTGVTYWTEIKPESTIGKNSSPVFKSRPPVFLCINAPFVFNHSATDADGDSLVYELFTPYLGASPMRNQPSYNNNGQLPVFPLNGNRLIRWLNPYSVYDEMGGNPILEIDPETGRLTITPTQNGQFVVGIKVKEYRNGVLIGETKRDYQFNVDNCVFDVVSVFSTAKVNCTNKGVVFTNLSSGAIKYRWDFGEYNIYNDTSNLTSPTYVYSKPGTYLVTLIAKNNVCIDTFDYMITVKANVSVKLGKDTLFCNPTTFVLDAGTNAKQYQWNTAAITQKITVTQTGNYIVTVTDAPCTAKDTISVIIDKSVFDAGPDTTICNDFFTPFVYYLNSPVIYKSYLWNDDTKLSNVNIPKTGKYWVTVTNQNNCTRTDSIEVFHNIPPKSDLKDTAVCIGYYALFDAKILYYTYLWNTGETTQQLRTNQPGMHWVKITNGQCTSADTAILSNIDPGLEIGRDTSFCGPFSFNITTNKPFVNYNWSNGGNQRTNTVTDSGYSSVTIQSIEGCFQSDSLYIINYPQNIAQLLGDTSACTSSIIEISSNDSMTNYLWNTGEITQQIKVVESGLYSVIITDKNGCKDTGYHRITKNPNAFPNDIYMPNAFTPNEDLLNEFYPNHKFHDLNAAYNLKIFDRWGEKLFETNSPGQNWDGYYQGKLCQNGVYVYTVAYLGCDNNSHLLKGSFHLMR